MIGLIKIFGDRSRIRKRAIVENGAAILPKALVKMLLGLNVLFAAVFAFNEIDKDLDLVSGNYLFSSLIIFRLLSNLAYVKFISYLY